MITRARHRTDLACRVQAVGVGGQLALLTLLQAGAGLGPVGWLAGMACAVFTCAVLAAALRRAHARWLTPADQVTLTRTVLIGGVTALVADHPGQGAPVAVLLTLTWTALLLDAVDGQVARRTGTASPVGARFDMEADAFLILVLSVQVATSLGAWVLAIGAMRYVFAVATLTTSWLRSALPPSFTRKTVAALQGIVLAVAVAEVLPRAVTAISVALALTSLGWSFGRDTLWLWRNRATSLSEPQAFTKAA